MTVSKNKTWLGIQWSFGSQVVNQAMVLVINLALLHWLTPQDFGSFAFPYLVFSFFRSFHDFGYGDVLIVKKDWNPHTYSSIFWLTVGIALICSVMMVFLAPLVSYWTQNEKSTAMLSWLALALSLGAVQAGLEVVFRKQLLFENLFWMEFLANIVSGIAALIMAWQGFGIYALMGKTLAYVGLLSLMSILTVPDRPRWFFSMAEIRTHFSFALANIGDQMVQFIFKNADTFLLSRYASAAQLGWYDRAFKLLVFPVQQASAAVARVVMPAFSSYGDDKEKLASAYLKLMNTAALGALPVLIVIPFVAKDAVTLLFEPSWQPLSPLFSIFTLMALTQGIFALGNPVFYLCGKVHSLFRFSLVSRTAAIVVLCWSIFSGQDILRIAFSFSLAAFLFVVPYQHLVLNLLSISWGRWWRALRMPLLGSACMLVLLFSLSFLKDRIPSVLGLVFQVGLAWLVYLWVVRKEVYSLWRQR